MRKLTLMAAVLALAVAWGPMTTSAQQIFLQSSSQDVIFTGDGSGGLYIQLGSCSGGTCTLSGGASGDASSYNFVTTGWTGSSIDAVSAGGGIFAPINLGGGTAVTVNFGAGPLPATLVDVIDAYSIATGKDKPEVNFDTPLAPGPGANDFIVNNLVINCSGLKAGVNCSLPDIANTSDWANPKVAAYAEGTISSGEVFTPEPGTMLLLGTGLVSLGGILRRRRNGAAS